MITKYLKSLVVTSIIILISTIVITILNYFNIINGTILKVIEAIIPIISIIIGAYLIGKSSTKKGYIEGIKYSTIWILILLIINLITKNTNLFDLLYFITIIFFSIISSSIGINRKKN